ncbi:MAG: GTP cyclohydrolase I [Actinomycetota bacterium]
MSSAAELVSRPGPSVVRGAPDLDAAETAAGDLFEALGVEMSSPDLVETPRRVAAMYRELLTPKPFNPTTFPNEDGYDELVLAKNIPFTSLCAHHALPFSGVAHVGYLPGDRILGLSKLARLVGFFSRSLQVQERLTKQIADWLQGELDPRGVGVVLEAEHLCMTVRGVQAAGTQTVTSRMYGLLRECVATRQEFLSLVGARPRR